MRTIKIFSFILLSVVLSDSLAVACQCIPKTLEEKFAVGDYVFVATVIATSLPGRTRVEVGQPNDRVFMSADPLEILFDPQTDYKGRSADLPKLHTVADGMSCGITIVLGARYIFFADRMGNVTRCSGSERITDPSEWRVLERKLRALSEQQYATSDKP